MNENGRNKRSLLHGGLPHMHETDRYNEVIFSKPQSNPGRASVGPRFFKTSTATECS